MAHLTILSLLSLAIFSVNADVYGLGLESNLPKSLVSINPQNGFAKSLTDFTFLAGDFKMLTGNYYDGNSEQYIFGNIDPPLLALTNTFSKKTTVVNLPQYGKLLSFTAYDGIVYAILGADEDIPYLGHLVAMDLTTKDTTRLAKVKIDPSKKFRFNAPLTYMPQNQLWITEIENSEVLLITIKQNVSVITPTKVEGGWDAFWNNVEDNRTLIGYKKGLVAFVDPFASTVTAIRSYGCAGSLAVAFQYDELYHLSNCGGKLVMDTFDFTNHSLASANLDSSLANTVGIHTAANYIPYGCGKPCSVNTDCQGLKTCHTCRLGKCIDDGQCNAFCLAAEDCYAGVCVGNCEFNRCGRRGCGTTCNNHDDCVAVSNQCQICRLGRCVDYGNCGSYCLTPLDCYGGNCIGKCSNWQCIP